MFLLINFIYLEKLSPHYKETPFDLFSLDFQCKSQFQEFLANVA